MNVLRCSVIFTAALLFTVLSYAQEPQPYYTQQLPPAVAENPTGTLVQPIQQRPIQTPPKRLYQNGIADTAGSSQPGSVNERTLPPGYGAPFPTGLPMPPNNGYKVAQVPNNTGLPNNAGQVPAANNPPANAGKFVGRAAPANRVVPFFLAPEEQIQLDEFLTRWEKYSEQIKRYDVDFNVFIYDATIPGQDLTKPHKTAFGYFKYIAKPMRFVYSVEGEWVGKEQVKRNDDPKTAGIFAEKIIIDEKSVFKFDYNAKNVLQINVPSEIIGRGIADSPLPLIFGAKTDDMKRRFSMRIKTVEQDGSMMVHLQAKPLLPEDQQEFALVELLLDKNTFRAKGLKRYDINGKAFTVYDLHSPVINGNLSTVLSDIKTYFTPSVPRGWKHEVNDWALEVQMAKREQPGTVPAGIAPPNQPAAEQRNEIQLYSPPK
ncbi:MAG: hypothetical protein LBN39_09175 [Planctomycetaceae bacterium]|jgi:TIGR03009 family protein|nr:hypothetical protein [Planctomycetaceae bacterium]